MTTTTEQTRDDDDARSDAPNDEPESASSFMRFLPVLAAILLIVTAVVSIGLQDAHYDEQDIPAEDWRGAAEYVRTNFVRGDVIRFNPVWNDDPRVFLDGFPTDLTSRPIPDVLAPYERVWILAGRGREVEMPQGYTFISSERFGEVEVRLYAVPESSAPDYDFMAELEDARVRRTRPDGSAPQNCSWNPAKDAFYCGRIDPWLYVKKRLLDMENEPRWCVYLPPVPPENQRHEILYKKVPMSDRIEGNVGFDSWSVRIDRGSETHFEIAVDDTVVYHQVIQPRDNRFHAYSADTSAFAGKKATVAFRTWAADFHDRYLCFTGRIP